MDLLLREVPDFDESRTRAMTERVHSSITKWNPESPFGFNVAVLAPPQVVSHEPIVFPMPYNYRIDRLVVRRLKVLATVTGRRVVAVDTPGITMLHSAPSYTPRAAMRLQEIWGAFRGDFGPLANAQCAALLKGLFAVEGVARDRRLVRG